MSENDPFIMSTPRSRLIADHRLHMRVGAALCECGLTFNTLRNQYHDVLRDLTEQWSCHVDELITASEVTVKSREQAAAEFEFDSDVVRAHAPLPVSTRSDDLVCACGALFKQVIGAQSVVLIWAQHVTASLINARKTRAWNGPKLSAHVTSGGVTFGRVTGDAESVFRAGLNDEQKAAYDARRSGESTSTSTPTPIRYEDLDPIGRAVHDINFPHPDDYVLGVELEEQELIEEHVAVPKSMFSPTLVCGCSRLFDPINGKNAVYWWSAHVARLLRERRSDRGAERMRNAIAHMDHSAQVIPSPTSPEVTDLSAELQGTNDTGWWRFVDTSRTLYAIVVETDNHRLHSIAHKVYGWFYNDNDDYAWPAVLADGKVQSLHSLTLDIYENPRLELYSNSVEASKRLEILEGN